VCGGKAASKSVLAPLLLLVVLTMPVFGQMPTSSPAASAPDMKVPAIAVDFRADTRRPMPSLNRIGVDPADQQPLTLREAITLALRNNKDIEIARDTVKMAEFDLLTARGSYDPRFSAQSYFEKIKTPATNVLSGAAKVITDDLTATARLEGLAPKGGGSYHVDFSSIRATSNSTFNVLNPSYPTAPHF
jgi:outer membrane protein TolC